MLSSLIRPLVEQLLWTGCCTMFSHPATRKEPKMETEAVQWSWSHDISVRLQMVTQWQLVGERSSASRSEHTEEAEADALLASSALGLTSGLAAASRTWPSYVYTAFNGKKTGTKQDPTPHLCAYISWQEQVLVGLSRADQPQDPGSRSSPAEAKMFKKR